MLLRDADFGDLQACVVDFGPETRSVEVYRPGKAVERFESATTVSGDPELPGFLLDLAKVW